MRRARELRLFFTIFPPEESFWLSCLAIGEVRRRMEAPAVDHLAAERKKGRFDVEAMKIVWAGSKHAFGVADRMARIVASDPVFLSPFPPLFFFRSFFFVPDPLPICSLLLLLFFERLFCFFFNSYI